MDDGMVWHEIVLMIILVTNKFATNVVISVALLVSYVGIKSLVCRMILLEKIFNAYTS